MSGITREALRELVRAGNYEEKYRDAYEQLIKEENAFLEKAKTGLREALEDFPYQEVAYDGGFDLLVEDTISDFCGYKLYCQEIEEPDGDLMKRPDAEVYYELHLCGKSCYVALHRYGYHQGWADPDFETFHFTPFDGDDWYQFWDEGYEDTNFLATVAECLGKEELGGEEETELCGIIDSLYDKHNLRRSEYE